jgi:hypothetical protein
VRCRGAHGPDRLSDSDHPDLLRLVTWARLEGRTTPSTQAQRTTSYRRRTDAIKNAQREGKVSTTLSATQMLDMIESLAVGWTTTARGLLVDTRKLNRGSVGRPRCGVAGRRRGRGSMI